MLKMSSLYRYLYIIYLVYDGIYNIAMWLLRYYATNILPFVYLGMRDSHRAGKKYWKLSHVVEVIMNENIQYFYKWLPQQQVILSKTFLNNFKILILFMKIIFNFTSWGIILCHIAADIYKLRLCSSYSIIKYFIYYFFLCCLLCSYFFLCC